VSVHAGSLGAPHSREFIEIYYELKPPALLGNIWNLSLGDIEGLMKPQKIPRFLFLQLLMSLDTAGIRN
jgi:hypothetical protein